MIDYVPTEIVAYADTEYPSFNGAYPLVLTSRISGYYQYPLENGVVTYHSFEFRYAGKNYPEGMAFPGSDTVGAPILAFLIREFGSLRMNTKTALDNVGVCYYVMRNVASFDRQYYRLPMSDVEKLQLNNPYLASNPVDGEDIYFLYNLGQLLVPLSSSISSILTFNVGGYTILSLLFTSGFMAYMTWVVAKWVFPS